MNKHVGNLAPIKTVGEPNKSVQVVITAPNIQTLEFNLIGTAPLMIAAFSQKSKEKIKATHEAGQQAKGKKVREARNFEEDCKAATHVSNEGWAGVHAGAFRTAMIDVCRLVGYKMTIAKLSIFIEPDGFATDNGTPVVRIIGPEPEMNISGVRNANGGLDLRARPMWRKWAIKLRVKYDNDQFAKQDIANLLARAGIQCGIGEGRPNSRMSTGIGFGTFRVE